MGWRGAETGGEQLDSAQCTVHSAQGIRAASVSCAPCTMHCVRQVPGLSPFTYRSYQLIIRASTSITLSRAE